MLHKNIVTMTICSQYGSIITYIFLLSKSQTLAPHVKLCKWEKDIENQYYSGSALSLTFACGPAPFVHITCVSARSVCKGVGVYPCKSQKAQVSSLKSYLWSLLEPSRRVFDVYWAPPDGSCIPMIEELIPSREELPHPKEGVSHWCWNWITSSRIL